MHIVRKNTDVAPNLDTTLTIKTATIRQQKICRTAYARFSFFTDSRQNFSSFLKAVACAPGKKCVC